MSKRFGRNQKRKLLNQLKEAVQKQEKASRLVSAKECLLEQERDKVFAMCSMVSNLEDAVKVNQVDINKDLLIHGYYNFVTMNHPLDFNCTEAVFQETMNTIHSVPIATLNTFNDSLVMCKHFEFSCGGKRVGFSVTDEWLKRMPRDQAIETISDQMAKCLYDEITGIGNSS